jgi:hypothetical protein
MSVPDPLDEDYGLWCELNVCPACDGVGEDYIEDEWNDSAGGYGVTWVCQYCGGSGIDPHAVETERDDYDE